MDLEPVGHLRPGLEGVAGQAVTAVGAEHQLNAGHLAGQAFGMIGRDQAAPASLRPDEDQRWVDHGDIVRVAGDDGMSSVARADGHTHIYYVRRPRGCTPGTHPKRHLGVQRDDRRVRRAQQASDPSLTSAAAPRLGQPTEEDRLWARRVLGLEP